MINESSAENTKRYRIQHNTDVAMEPNELQRECAVWIAKESNNCFAKKSKILVIDRVGYRTDKKIYIF